MSVFATNDVPSDTLFDYAGALLYSCFDADTIKDDGPLDHGQFIVSGIDDDKDVTIRFDVTGISGLQCTLHWAEEESESIGSIQSVNVSNRMPIQPSWTGMPTEIKLKMSIVSSNEFIQIESLNPNGLTSGKFIRAVVFSLSDAFYEIFGESLVTLLETDYSLNRELFWLVRAEGGTYFELEWGLEYECFLDLDYEVRMQMLEISAQAQNLPATMAFLPELQVYSPIEGKNRDEHDHDSFRFDHRFIEHLEIYKISKDQGAFETMTIRQVLKEFIPLWLHDERYTPLDVQLLAQNTFMYFFRNHPNFTDFLAAQVLTRFDTACNSMTGFPGDPEIADITFEFRKNTLHHGVAQQGDSITRSSNDGASNISNSGTQTYINLEDLPGEVLTPSRKKQRFDEDKEEHISTSFHGNSTFHIWFIFTFFFIFLGLLLQERHKSEMQTFDTYSEL